MSKHLKKLLKEKETAQLEERIKEVDPKTLTYQQAPPKQNLFANFAKSDSEDEQEQAPEPQQVSKPADNAPSAPPKKPKKKKNKKPNVDTKALEEEKDKAIDEYFNELAKNQKEQQNDDFVIKEEFTSQPFNGVFKASTLLDVHTSHFNYNKELEKYFKGTKLVESKGQMDGLSKREQNMIRAQMAQHKSKRRYYLTSNEDVVQRLNDKLELAPVTATADYTIYTFVPGSKLRSLQETYDAVRDTHDPNAILDFLQTNPYYPEALYDIGEYFRLKGNIKDANLMLEKLLYFYEESFSYEFHLLDNYKERLCFLDYNNSPFNQVFFRAVLKFLIILTKRACYKSAFEYNKLLLRVNPLDDPTGALMIIDHTALSAGKYVWFCEFARDFGKHYFGSQYSVLLFPNVLFSFALALFREESKEITSEKLPHFISPLTDQTFDRITNFEWSPADNDFNFWIALAILLYPELFKSVILSTEMNKQNPRGNKWSGAQNLDWSELLAKPLFKERVEKEYYYPFLNAESADDFEGLNKAASIYGERNRLLWKDRNINLWLKGIAGQLVNHFDAAPEKLAQFFKELTK